MGERDTLYSSRRSKAIRHGIDCDMAVIEDAVARMKRRVPAEAIYRPGWFCSQQLEEIREIAEGLKSFVETRTERNRG